VVPVLDPDQHQQAFLFAFLEAGESPEVLFRLQTWRPVLDTAQAAFVMTEPGGRLVCTSNTFIRYFGKPVTKPDLRFPYEALIEPGEGESLAEGHRVFLSGQSVSGLARAGFLYADGTSEQLAVRWVTVAMGEFPIAKIDLIDTSGLGDGVVEGSSVAAAAAEPVPDQAAAAAVPEPVPAAPPPDSLGHAALAAQTTPDALLLVSGTSVCFASQACQELLGIAPDQLIGQELELLICADNGEPTELEQKLGTGSLGWHCEQVRIKHLSGYRAPARLHAAVGETWCTITLREDTERAQEEDRQAFTAMQDAGAAAASDTAILGDPLAVVCREFGADWAEVVRCDPDQQLPPQAVRIERGQEPAAPIVPEQPAEPVSLLQEWYELLTITGAPVAVDAATLSSGSQGSVLVALVPVAGDEAIWLLYLYSATSSWSYRDGQRLTRFCQVFARLARNALRHRRCRRADTARNLLARVLGTCSEELLVIDTEHRVIAVSRSLARAIGAEPDKICGRHLSSVFDQATTSRLVLATSIAVTNRQSCQCELTGTTSFGTELQVAMTVAAELAEDGEDGEDGEVCGFVGRGRGRDEC
jgi:PAS domain-containing protein